MCWILTGCLKSSSFFFESFHITSQYRILVVYSHYSGRKDCTACEWILYSRYWLQPVTCNFNSRRETANAFNSNLLTYNLYYNLCASIRVWLRLCPTELVYTWSQVCLSLVRMSFLRLTNAPCAPEKNQSKVLQMWANNQRKKKRRHITNFPDLNRKFLVKDYWLW